MEIVYLSPAVNIPIGGIKVIYRHSEMLNEAGISSSVFHPDDASFSCNWFNHNAIIRSGKRKWFRKKHMMYEKKPFNPKSDFIVIPEVWANQIGAQCIQRKLRYGIFVQNGYMIHQGGKKNIPLLNTVYEKADLILSISEDTTEVLKLSFPNLNQNKICRVMPNIAEAFKGQCLSKKKIITYMPRKLTRHAEMIHFFLEQSLPEGWKLAAIDNKSEQAVVALLKESSIFLSFCEAEGFALPPIEAALAGNLVIGYTGEGAKEYFKPPIFTEVHCGDLINFIGSVKNTINQLQPIIGSQAYQEQLHHLSEYYSSENESRLLLEFGRRAQQILNQTDWQVN
jgi:hypothetical protein